MENGLITWGRTLCAGTLAMPNFTRLYFGREWGDEITLNATKMPHGIGYAQLCLVEGEEGLGCVAFLCHWMLVQIG
jgi:hypothetical protein